MSSRINVIIFSSKFDLFIIVIVVVSNQWNGVNGYYRKNVKKDATIIKPAIHTSPLTFMALASNPGGTVGVDFPVTTTVLVVGVCLCKANI